MATETTVNNRYNELEHISRLGTFENSKSHFEATTGVGTTEVGKNEVGTKTLNNNAPLLIKSTGATLF